METLDLNNNETLAKGIIVNNDGTFTAQALVLWLWLLAVNFGGLRMKIDIKKHLMETARIHRDMGDPLTIEDLADLALDIQTKNIQAHEKNQELFFVGYTNGAQVLYASEEEGSFYKDTENECYIPLYMLKTHEHRLSGSLTNGLNFEKILEARKDS